MLFEAVLETEIYGQQMVNRWNYESTSVPASVTLSFGLSAAFGAVGTPGNPPAGPGTILEAIRNLQSADLRYVQFTCRAIYDVLDFYATPFVPQLNAAVGSAADAPFVAIGFRTNRVRQDIRRGTKRLGAAPDTFSTGAGQLTSAALTVAQTLATRMTENLTYNDEGTTLTFSPVVVQKKEYETPRGNVAYEYYATLAEQETHLARSIIWEPYQAFRSQNSRQYGRGI